jgi:hypothetical protein
MRSMHASHLSHSKKRQKQATLERVLHQLDNTTHNETVHTCNPWCSFLFQRRHCRYSWESLFNSTNQRTTSFWRVIVVFTNSIAKLTASHGGANNEFGFLYALAISGNHILVGAYGYDAARGAEYLFGDPENPELGRSYSEWPFLALKVILLFLEMQ